MTIDKRVLAMAIEAKRKVNGIHYEALVCAQSEVEQRKSEVIKAHPLYDCRFFTMIRMGAANG